MKYSERVKEVLPQCVELWTEKFRQQVTTNTFAPSKDEFAKMLKGPASELMQGIFVEAYASAILLVLDEEQQARREEMDRLWSTLRGMNGGSFPGDP